MSDTPKRSLGGRPPVEEPRVVRGVRFTALEWATYQALGGATWLRDVLASADLTPEQAAARDQYLAVAKTQD